MSVSSDRSQITEVHEEVGTNTERRAQNLPAVMKVEEMGRFLGIGRSLAYELTRRPGFPVIRLSEKALRIPTDALLRWIDQQTSGDEDV